MITHRPAVDWLTLTTFDLKTQMLLGKLLLRHAPNAGSEATAKKEGRYSGRGGVGWFGGEGEQNGKPHMIYRFSGDLSDKIAFDQLRPPVDCTRLDIQLTMPLPCSIEEAFDLYVDLSRVLDENEKERGIRGRKVGGPLYPSGESTIYVGTREGTQRFYRIYVKEGPDGDWFIRFEVEFKDKNGLAGKAWRSIGNDPLSVVSLLAGELATLPPHLLLDPLHEQMKLMPQELMKQERQRSDPNKTLEWLRRQVAPAMRRMLGYHDTRDEAQQILMDWLSFAASLEELESE